MQRNKLTSERYPNTTLYLAKECLGFLSKHTEVDISENNRKFEEIVVEYPPEDLCTYPEYRGKPYFSIKYKEKDDCFIGYGTYNPKVFSRYIRDYFIKNYLKPKGHWMNHIEYCKKNNFIPSGLISYYWCSECECGIESKHFHRTEYNYCPKCGAQMN